MTSEKTRFLSGLLLPMLLTLQCTTAAVAQDASALKFQEAAVDSTPVSDESAIQSSRAPASTGGTPIQTLKGSVEKKEAALGAEEADGGVDSQEVSSDPAVRRQLALQKLASGAKLTSDDYRDLGIGVLGYDSDRTYFTQFAKVTVLVPGCPAEKAGIKLGDLIVVDEEEAEDAGIKDPSIPTWVFSCGVEGQAVDLTIKRGDELLQFHLVRMNMEDVPDAHARHQYEQLVRQTGLSQGQVEINKPVSVPSALRALLGL